MYDLVGRLAALTLLSSLAGGSIAQPQRTPDYDIVKLEIVSGNKVIGKPEITLEPGSSAIATSASQNGYSIKVETRRLSTPLGRLVSLEYYSPYKDRWSLAGKPNLQTNLGEDNLISFKTADGGDLRIKIRIDKLAAKMPTGSRANSKCSSAELIRWKRDMASPVSYMIRRVSLLQDGGPCCTLCSNNA